MKKLNFISQLRFDRGQRVGILFLTAAITLLLYVSFFVSFSSEINTFDSTSEEIKCLQQQLDSLRMAELISRRPKSYPFNPNFITDYKAYVLGMTPTEFDRLKTYREKGKWINSIADFKKVTQVSDSLLQAISPRFKFPDWVKNRKARKQYVAVAKRKLRPDEKADLNLATAEQLQEVSGIGPALSERILKRRTQLNGFSHDLQLYDVWGLKPEVVQRTLGRFTVKNPKPIERMNVNRASASDLSTIPGISFSLGKKIWEFVRLREGVVNISELEKIEEITARKLQLIELYLFAE